MNETRAAAAADRHYRRRARENNLKNVSLDIPSAGSPCFSACGSGKSSLVFNTIAAESQRLINETYPAFVQRFSSARPADLDARSLVNISAAIMVTSKGLGGDVAFYSGHSHRHGADVGVCL